MGAARAEETPAARAERLYQAAHEHWQRHSNDVIAAWEFARACFDYAEFAAKSPARARLAEEGIAACRFALTKDPQTVGAHYYLALNLGQLAQTKSLGALKLVGEMEKTLKAALEIDPKFDYAGPHRTLGLLYADAPGWPISIGNRSQAGKHLRKAVELSPDYPDNQLSLLEFFLKTDQASQFKEHWPAANKALQDAQEKLTGEQWTHSWRDWNSRWNRLRKRP